MYAVIVLGGFTQYLIDKNKNHGLRTKKILTGHAMI